MIEDALFYRLPDKRQLCYAQYGDAGGYPVVYCHGFPACRLEAKLAHTAAQTQGIRLIAIDRPGFGRSEFLTNRSMLDWPRDVRSLMDHLGINTFSVLGVSGGAPHAMSCAIQMKERIRKFGLVCGLGKLTNPGTVKELRLLIRWLANFEIKHPKAGYIFLSQILARLFQVFPALSFEAIKRVLPPSDKEILNIPYVKNCLKSVIKETFAQGGTGPSWEFHLFTHAWGFDLHDISVETYIWHGGQDRTVPLVMSKRHAQAIPGAKMKIFDNEGHFSLPIRHAEEILFKLK